MDIQGQDHRTTPAPQLAINLQSNLEFLMLFPQVCCQIRQIHAAKSMMLLSLSEDEKACRFEDTFCLEVGVSGGF